MPDFSNMSPGASSLMGQVRNLFGADNVVFTSGYRSPSHNANTRGASRTSQHMTGDAFDFRVKGMDPIDVQNTIAAQGWRFGQSIAEYGGGYGPRNHLSVGDKKENLILRGGKYVKSALKGGGLLSAGARALGMDGAADVLDGMGRSALEAGASAVPGGSIALGALDGMGITGECNFVCQFQNWITESGFFQRLALAFFAFILLFAAFYLMKGDGLGALKKGIVNG